MEKFLMSLMCLLMVFTLAGCNTKTNSDDKKNNSTDTETETDTNEAVALDSQVVNGLTFEHFAITRDNDDISIVYFDITNKTENSIDVGSVTFALYEDGYEILSLKEDINETIEPGQSKSIIENFDISMPNIDEVRYTVE